MDFKLKYVPPKKAPRKLTKKEKLLIATTEGYCPHGIKLGWSCMNCYPPTGYPSRTKVASASSNPTQPPADDQQTHHRPPSEEKVHHPAHYTSGKFETIDVIEDWKLGFNLGNSVKYISRADHKGRRLEDLRKARWYLDREIQNEEKK